MLLTRDQEVSGSVWKRATLVAFLNLRKTPPNPSTPF